MKIVFKNEDNNLRCLTQVRDFKYLAKRFNSEYFNKLYEAEIAKGLKDEDFVELVKEESRRVVLDCPYIVTFNDVANCDDLTISRLMVLTGRALSSKDKLDNEHKRTDLSDILAFKSNSLPYQIPVTFDNNVFMDLGDVYLGTSTIPGYYMLRKKNINADLADFLANNYYLLFRCLDLKDVCEGFNSVKVGDELLFRFNTKTKTQKRIEDIKKKLLGK